MILVDNFENQLQEYWQGKINNIPTASTMVNHIMELRKNRLNKFNYQLRYRIEKNTSFNPHHSQFGDAKYDVTVVQDHIFLTRAIFKGDKLIQNKKENKILFTHVESLIQKSPDESEIINCPNCGAPQSIAAIRTGCQFCGTHFEMTDIYPSVSLVFFLDDYALSKNNMETTSGKVQTIAKGYLNLFKLFSQIPDVVEKVKDGALSSNKVFEEFMCQYRPDFSFQQFGDAALSMFLVYLFSDEPNNLPFINIENCPVLEPTLVDYDYKNGGISVVKDSCKINGDFATVDVLFYINEYYDDRGSLRLANNKYCVSLKRNINAPVDFGFSFTKINCPSCGAVFDALKNCNCPYCSTRYQMKGEDWTITDIKKLR